MTLPKVTLADLAEMIRLAGLALTFGPEHVHPDCSVVLVWTAHDLEVWTYPDRDGGFTTKVGTIGPLADIDTDPGRVERYAIVLETQPPLSPE